MTGRNNKTNTPHNLELAAEPLLYQPVLQYIPQTLPVVSIESLFQFLKIDGQWIQQAHKQATLNFDALQDELGIMHIMQEIMKNTRIIDWFRSIKSDMLVFRRIPMDNYGSREFAFAAATMVDALLGKYPSEVVLDAFFPIPVQDSALGSFYLLRSLVYQLLQYPNAAAFTPMDLSVPAWEPNHLQYMFERILYAFPFGATVYVIIYGLENYAINNEAESNLVVRLLNKLSTLPIRCKIASQGILNAANAISS